MSGAAGDGPRTRPKASEVAFEGSTDAVTSGIVRDADERTGAMSRHAHGGRGAATPRGARALGTARDLAGVATAVDPDADDGHEASEDAIEGTGRTASRAARARRDASLGRAEREQATAGKGAEGQAGTGAGGPGGADVPGTRDTAARAGEARAGVTRGAGGRSRTSVLRATRARHAGHATRARGASRALASRRAASAAAASRAQAAATGAAAKAGGTAVAAAAPATAFPVAGVLAGILAFVLASVVISQLLGSVFGFWENEESKRSVAGLPPYITYSMVEEALRCQEEYGHPAGCTIAQIILESGVGDHLSGLATRDNNLFGIKWASSFASCPEVTGKESWQTGEEYDGQSVTITDAFTCFASYEDCIRFRSRVLLQNSRYADNALIRQAISEHSSDLMAEGLKDAGYATSSSYVDSLKSVMDTYGLRRFDTMTVADLVSSTSADGGTVVAAAMTQLGTPYVWGGTTPYVGLDCSGLTQWCYAQAGISIPRNSEDQHAAGTSVPLSEARAGDILWKPGHVAIYLGGNSYIHAPKPGDHVRVAEGISYFTCAVRF
ncbi:MAG: NlpC/P60 family protein [Atopobiaceae bacterium]|nr:NlpC/P60 family protein [Atopobiaceae bacterium]MDD4380943.1 NlpC/P60 family protein [Atopobiaceae bacterium]